MENQRELTVLLIEDDQFACEEIRNYINLHQEKLILHLVNLLNGPIYYEDLKIFEKKCYFINGLKIKTKILFTRL